MPSRICQLPLRDLPAPVPTFGRAQTVDLRAPADLARGPLERVEVLAHLEVDRIRSVARAQELHRMRGGDLVDVREDDERGRGSRDHVFAEEGVHVLALRDLVLERALARGELVGVEDGVDDAVAEGREALRVRGEGEVLGDAGEGAVGLDDEELGGDVGELVEADLEEVELGREEDGVPYLWKRIGTGAPAMEGAEVRVEGNTLSVVVGEDVVWAERLVP